MSKNNGSLNQGVILRIAVFMFGMDTANFNFYYNRTLPALKSYNKMVLEEERLRIEREGHPDDIYIKKPA